jgi:hypothetical protein
MPSPPSRRRRPRQGDVTATCAAVDHTPRCREKGEEGGILRENPTTVPYLLESPPKI